VFVLESISKPFIKERNLVSEEDLHVLSDLGHQEGSIEEDEKNIIQNVFRLNDLRAKDIMTPRGMMVCFQADAQLETVKNDLYSLVHSRIPVYEKTKDKIVGILYVKDLASMKK